MYWWLEFVKNLENFHFSEKSLHRNESKGKVATHCALVMVNFEYFDHWGKDEDIFRNACNMTTLNKQFRHKITITGGKGSSSRTSEQQTQEKEATKEKEEEA